MPYAVFSIYYQWRIVKQWCVLCLVVQALLALGAINVVVNNFLFPFPYLSFSFIVYIVLLYLLPVLLWYTIKPQFLILQEAKNTKREYLRIKFNTEIFDTLLKKQKPITGSIEGLGINLGNPAATNTLIKVCNPYCGPCAKAHLVIESLLEEVPNLNVKIIFTTPINSRHPFITTTRHLMTIDSEGNLSKTTEALDAWYNTNEKKYEHFAQNFPVEGNLLMHDDKIQNMHRWCTEMNIEYTPTLFINGYQLPSAYSIGDLRYFLLE